MYISTSNRKLMALNPWIDVMKLLSGCNRRAMISHGTKVGKVLVLCKGKVE